MFGKKQGGSKPQSRIDSLIGAGTKIDGNIIFSGGLRIDGEVRGNVSAEKGAESTLVISEHACVEGQIEVAHAVINGTIVGSVSVSQSLELQPNARVTGDVDYHRLEMQPGAVVQGRLIHEVNAQTVELKLASGAN